MRRFSYNTIYLLIVLVIVNNVNVVKGGNIETAVQRWGTVMPYEISTGLLNRRADIETAISMIHASTNARLRPRQAGDVDWVIFQLGAGCSSFIGRSGGSQVINLAQGCPIGTIVHEILHAFGGHHEHTRPDRDQFVIVNYANIRAGTENNFAISRTAQGVGQYDYGSIMHYPRTGFSINGQDTVTPRAPNVQIGQRTALSSGDIQTFNALVTSSPPPTDLCQNVNCLNNGICNPGDGRCICVNGYTGDRCQVPPVDRCENVNCLNGGRCDPDNGRCVCTPGYSGFRCQIFQPVVDRCRGVDCLNGGVCNRSDGQCECPAGYIGTRCQITDLCLNTNCLNGGVCNQSNGRCVCTPPYYGTRCENEQSVNRCLGVACLNGGVCLNGECMCRNGFTGDRCQSQSQSCQREGDGDSEQDNISGQRTPSSSESNDDSTTLIAIVSVLGGLCFMAAMYAGYVTVKGKRGIIKVDDIEVELQ